MAKRIFHYAKYLFYPWSLWWLSAWYPRVLRRRYAGKDALAIAVAWFVQAFSYASFGLPVTVYVTGELLISLNEAVLGDEQANHQLQSDFDAGLADQMLRIPGPASPDPEPVAYAPTDEYRRYLVEKYAPVIVQKVARFPMWDTPVFLDFDGNLDPHDNLEHEAQFRPHHPGIYGEVTAETTDSFYLTYSVYHIKDYDHPIREWISNWSFHDNDNEGFMIRVDKQTMQVVQASTWFHNRFLLFNHTGESTGSEPVHGKLRLEGGNHLIIYAQSLGHGVRCAQVADGKDLETRAKVLRFRGTRPPVVMRADDEMQVDVTYDLKGFREWYARARGPFSKEGQGTELFEEAILLGHYEDGTPMVIGRFIGGRDYAIGGWSRPKPMWSWDDGWDGVPVLMWHFAPSYVFESHSGVALSHEYLYDEPAQYVFGRPIDEVLALATELPNAERGKGNKWTAMDTGDDIRHDYWIAVLVFFKRYLNYLFRALG